MEVQEVVDGSHSPAGPLAHSDEVEGDGALGQDHGGRRVEEPLLDGRQPEDAATAQLVRDAQLAHAVHVDGNAQDKEAEREQREEVSRRTKTTICIRRILGALMNTVTNTLSGSNALRSEPYVFIGLIVHLLVVATEDNLVLARQLS